MPSKNLYLNMVGNSGSPCQPMGPTDADTVMLVHGFSLDHTTWGAVAERLVASGELDR